MHRDLPRLAKSELLERLAEGHGARITVLAPNRRLGQALAREFDQAQVARGLATWETADILSFGAFVERLWEDALYSDLALDIPLLLAPSQELALWEEAIGQTKLAESLFSTAPAAGQCREAWRLSHAWRLDLRSAGALNDDARAFLEWSSRYARATRDKRQTDAARLPDVVAPLLAHAGLRKPATVALFGFDLPTPQMRAFVDALGAQGCSILEAAPAPRRSTVARVELAEPKEEIQAAARWARSRLESPSALGEGRGEGNGPPRIGVVVPDLARSRAMVQRLFANVMQPAHQLPGAATQLPFNVSLGAALAEFPMVADALLALALAGPQVAFHEASRLILSPFIAGAQAEMPERARLDARLRERCGATLSLQSLLRLCTAASAPRAPVLVDRLSRLAELRKSSLFGAKAPAAWARAFSDALRIIGLPGERALDSTEHQTFAKWHELLGEFAALERVTAKMGYVEACQRLAGMARDTLFQPEAADVPVQVVGVLESAGLEFDHLWVMGLTDEAWPMPARPNALIPIGVQRAARIPQADPTSALELDRRITQGWMRSAGEVVFSHARMQGESELAPSPLIAGVPASPPEALAIGAFATLRDAMHAAGRVESIDDARAPALAGGAVTGGTRLFRDHAACPFRAFACHRLKSEPLETPRPGLNVRDRGTLAHTMLAEVWKSLGSKRGLDAAPAAQLEALLATSADAAIADMKRRRSDALPGRFAELEKQRLVQLGRDWLALESRREDFEVVAVEAKRPVTFGGLTVNARLDRMDRLPAGAYAIIDYKSGACATAAWMGARPDEPQLPMYALGGGEDVAAVAFAQLKAGKLAFRGIGRAPDLIPGVKEIARDSSRAAKQYRDWAQLVAGWRVELEAIGRGFASGDARVDPKRGAATCEKCQQMMVCRIAEKAPFGAVGKGDDDE